MLEVTIKLNEFTIRGHAEYAEHGRDIVCSAISAIAQTAVLGLETYGFLTKEVQPGYMHVVLQTSSIETMAIMATMEMGMVQISKQYPEYVQIKGGYERDKKN